jgi:hypothetical protein
MHETTQSAMLKPDEAHAIVGKDKISRRAFYNALNRGEISLATLWTAHSHPAARVYELASGRHGREARRGARCGP